MDLPLVSLNDLQRRIATWKEFRLAVLQDGSHPDFDPLLHASGG